MKDAKENYKKFKKRINTSWEEIDRSHDNELRGLYVTKNLNREIYKQGEDWYRSGLTLADADESLQNDFSFVSGFERGRRLALIEESKSNSKTK